jgi:hypothetical protein
MPTDATQAMASDAEATRAMPTDATQAMASDAEATRAMPTDATQAMASDAEATRAMPTDATRALPVGDEQTQRVQPHVWAARASVPINAGPAPVRAPTEWEEVRDEHAAGSWLRPVLITVAVLVLLGILATGLWLIFIRAGDRPGPAPVIPVTSSGASRPSETPSQTEVPTTGAAQVAVPDVVGQSEAAARQQLTAKGLTVGVSRRPASGVDPGTVIATDPGSGETVEAGSRVTLIVAAEPAPAPTTAAPTRSASTHPPSPTPARTAAPTTRASVR